MKDNTKRKLNFIDKVFLFLTVTFCISLLISYLAPYCDPATYWVVAFFGLAHPILLVLVLLTVLYWLLRRRIWVLLPLICIAAGWKILNESIGLRMPIAYSAAADTNNIRVMTYNVHGFRRYDAKKFDVPVKDEMLSIITEKQPTVLCIQEFFTSIRAHYNVLDSIQQILNTNYCYYEKLRPFRGGFFGMIIISKLPVIDTGFIQLANIKRNDDQCLYADIKKGNKIFRIYNVHLQSIKFDPKDYTYLNEVSGEGKTDAGSTKRLGSKLKTAFIKRSAQVKLIKESAAKCPYPYIIAGDFNDTPASYSVNQMESGLKNAFREKGSGIGVTYDGDFPNFQIDYVMTSPVFNIMSYDVVKKKLSDHYPVYCDMVLK